MKEIGISEVQEIALDILLYIDKICRKHEIKYSVFYGSLIGIERHGGFIPWDDDIDIVLLRSEYERLMEILEKQDNNYTLLEFKTRETYRYPFAKLVDSRTSVKTKQLFNGEEKDLGVFVDIFPLDTISDDPKKRKQHHDIVENYRLNMMDSLKFCYARSYSKIKSAIKLIVKFPKHIALIQKGGYKYWRDLYESTSQKYKAEDLEYCGYMEFTDIDWGVFPKSWFEQVEDVSFNNHSVMAIKARREFLELRYGDYMKMPPIEERKTHHPYIFYKV